MKPVASVAVYAALVRKLGPPDEAEPACVAWRALGRTDAGLTLQWIEHALVLSVVEPSAPAAHAHWTLIGRPTPSAPGRDPDAAIPEALRWLADRGLAMPLLRPALVPEVPRCGGQQGFSRCAYAKGHPGPCTFQEADYRGGY